MPRAHPCCDHPCCQQAGVPWRPLVYILTGIAAWDAIGLLGGDRFYASPSYDWLRAVAPPWLGMRAYALLVAPLFLGLALSLYRWERRGRGTRALAWMLSSAAAWWVCWTIGIGLSFAGSGQIYAWGSLGKLIGVAAIAYVTARVPPPADRPPRRGEGT